ncbi:hypothetical protein [Actinomadura flavalba]|uniref:hypothetical protein n=1 Tax=Actinomadura flavalba TaxID=1120938 RepID=UPI00037BA1D7|nr:hypothetical protein [Actinomadura flavalba]
MTRAGRLPLILGATAVVLAALGIWSTQQASALRNVAAADNTALTDNAATSEAKGAIGDIVTKIFSYTYTDPAKTEQAARASLTGAASTKYATLFNGVKTQGPAQKLILTTTVTESAVISLTSAKARLLVFADQRTTNTADGKTALTPTMLTVDATKTSGKWKLTDLNTLDQ